jgi:ankyrin repeat protein
VLSKQSLGELQSEFPEDVNCICNNLWTQFDIGKDQKDVAKDEENLDKEKLLTKVRILESSKFRKEQQFNVLCKAARQGNLETVVLLARQGADLNQTDYDGRTAMVTRVFAAGFVGIMVKGVACRL